MIIFRKDISIYRKLSAKLPAKIDILPGDLEIFFTKTNFRFEIYVKNYISPQKIAKMYHSVKKIYEKNVKISQKLDQFFRYNFWTYWPFFEILVSFFIYCYIFFIEIIDLKKFYFYSSKKGKNSFSPGFWRPFTIPIRIR